LPRSFPEHFRQFLRSPGDFERLIGLDGTVCRIRLRRIPGLGLARGRLRTREHRANSASTEAKNGRSPLSSGTFEGGVISRVAADMTRTASAALSMRAFLVIFPETKNCISAKGAFQRRLTVDPSELLDPPVAPGPPRNLHAAGIVSWPAGSPDQE
jgi:hypothetical protein